MITAFDIGGSSIKAATVSGLNDISVLPRRATPLQDFQLFVEILREFIAENPTLGQGVAISLTGIIDTENGLAKCANIPCINQRHLSADLENALQMPVWIANDADCFTLAETHFGAAQEHENVFGIILGTGVGGGLVLNGKLVTGVGGFAGEWGHGPTLPNETAHWPEPIPHFKCGCGQKGCVDTIGGARGLERLHKYLHGSDLTSTCIVENWINNNTHAVQTVHCMVDLISGPLAMVLNVTGSSVAPVGGGLSQSSQLIELLNEVVTGKLLRKSGEPIIVPYQCQIEPGLMGAAVMGLQNLKLA
ncbi:MAG: ROK family protein [Hyphomicrobiales bacterium]